VILSFVTQKTVILGWLKAVSQLIFITYCYTRKYAGHIIQWSKSAYKSQLMKVSLDGFFISNLNWNSRVLKTKTIITPVRCVKLAVCWPIGLAAWSWYLAAQRPGGVKLAAWRPSGLAAWSWRHGGLMAWRREVGGLAAQQPGGLNVFFAIWQKF
jgi:hypothetical protein